MLDAMAAETLGIAALCSLPVMTLAEGPNEFLLSPPQRLLKLASVRGYSFYSSGEMVGVREEDVLLF